MRFLKVTLPVSLAFILGVVAMASVFIPHHLSRTFINETTVWFRVVGAVTMFIGAYSLLRVHYGRIKRQQKGWGYSALLYVFFALMVFFGVMNFGVRVKGQAKAMSEAEARALAAKMEQQGAKPVVRALTLDDGSPLKDPQGGPLFCVFDPGDKKEGPVRSLVGAASGKALNGPKGKPLYVDLKAGRTTETLPTGFLGPFVPRNLTKDLKEKEGTNWIFEAIQRPASSTQYSLLGFFICSAAYRTFRAKTPEAAVLLVASLIVMLGQVPIAALIWNKIPVASQWLLDVPNMAVKRAIMFGICVGAVGTSLRVMFGIERSYMGSD